MSKHPVEALRELTNQGVSLSAAAQQLGIPYQSAYYLAKVNGFLRRQKPSWAHLYEVWRAEYQAGSSIREIASKYGSSSMAVRIAIRGLARSFARTLKRPDYFHQIDTEEKAYWFGLLWSDGSINDKRAGQKVVQISLTQQDATDPKENEVGLLEAFREDLGTDYAINSRRNWNDTGEVLHLSIVNDQMADDLIFHGIVPRKSENKLGLVPIDLPDSLVPSFSRGLLDGDGTMYLASHTHERTGYVSWTIQPRWTGGYNVLAWLIERWGALGLIDRAPRPPQFSGGTSFIYLAPENARSVVSAMYARPLPSLRRKREKAMSLISDLHPQDWQDYNGDRSSLPPRDQSPTTHSEAGKLGAAARWGKEIEVIHGDAFKLLPQMTSQAALVLTDMPYSQESRDRGRRKWPFDPFTFAQTKRALALCGEASTGWVIVATMDLAFIGRLRDDCPAPLRFVRVSTWEKEHYHRRGGDAEYIAFFIRKGVTSQYFPPAVFVYKSNGHSGHPTSKPVGLYEELIRNTTEAGDLVLDPFCGSGTTGAAAVRVGRRAVLIDKEEQYVRMSRRRTKVK